MRTFQAFGFALMGVMFLSCGGPLGTGPPDEEAIRTGNPWRPTAEPGLYPRPFETPAMGMPVELGAPLKVELNPYAKPHVWLGARTVTPGETVAVAALGLDARTVVRLALADGQPVDYRFCGAGHIDPGNPAVRGECRIPPDAAGPVRVVAYDSVIDGRELASANVLVAPLPRVARVFTYDPPPGATLDMGGVFNKNTALHVNVFDPFGREVHAFVTLTDADGQWRARWLLPADALLGRWRVAVRHGDIAASIAQTSFVVRPLLGFEAEREHLGLYGAYLPPGSAVTFRFYDPTGEPAGEVSTIANRFGFFMQHATAPACAAAGTWFARVSYTDAMSEPAWFDVTFSTPTGWCFVY